MVTEAGGVVRELEVALEQLHLAVGRTGHSWRLFFLWLLQCVRRINNGQEGVEGAAAYPVHPRPLAAFLRDGLQSDALGLLLLDNEALGVTLYRCNSLKITPVILHIC